MKQIIENYGRIIVLIAAAFGAVFLIRNTVYSQLKANGVIQDTNHISSNEFFQKQGRPKLSGVRGEDGTARRLVIRKEEKLIPRKLVKAEDKKETIYEIADLAYHVLVLMVEAGISLEDVRKELASRHIIDHKVKQEKMTK